MSENDLTASARLWGVETEYYDVLGRRHTASPETVARLIDAIAAGRERPNHVDPAGAAVPQRAFQGDGRRLWGIAVQLYALRSHRNWGHGDFTDLSQLVALVAARGASAIGLNPLHALFPDRAEDASPYSPNSRLFLNPLYIDVEAIPEFPGVQAAGLEDEIAALRESELIAYARVARAKLAALHLAHQRFRALASAERRAEFETYRAEQGDTLLRFAAFECLRRQHAPKPWPQWPALWRRPDHAALLALRQQHDEQCEFHEFTQWVADRQLAACQETARQCGMPIGLYTDLAVGIDPHGTGAWIQQDVVLADVSVGAPPDDYNLLGQDWGLAPFNPHALPANDFAAMRRMMAATMRHAGAIRVDHVLGFKRVWMIPHGNKAADGAYVRFPFEALLGAISEESNRFKSIVIGEDLGTVPEGFHETLAQWGLWGCRVMLFEREGEGRFRPPEHYPAEVLATFNTHDLPSFRGWLEGHDLRVKRAIGVDPGESDEARAHSQAALRAALSQWAPSYPPDDIAAVAAFLGATPSRLVVIALDDVMGVRDQINIPGTVDRHPNWRRKLPITIEDLDTHDGLGRVTAAFTQAGRNFAG
jgi:4-alpha-glucanotransferase